MRLHDPKIILFTDGLSDESLLSPKHQLWRQIRANRAVLDENQACLRPFPQPGLRTITPPHVLLCLAVLVCQLTRPNKHGRLTWRSGLQSSAADRKPRQLIVGTSPITKNDFLKFIGRSPAMEWARKLLHVRFRKRKKGPQWLINQYWKARLQAIGIDPLALRISDPPKFDHAWAQLAETKTFKLREHLRRVAEDPPAPPAHPYCVIKPPPKHEWKIGCRCRPKPKATQQSPPAPPTLKEQILQTIDTVNGHTAAALQPKPAKITDPKPRAPFNLLNKWRASVLAGH